MKVRQILTDAPLILEQAANGGWTIKTQRGQGYASETVGAYTNAADMIAALSEALFQPPAAREAGQ